MALPETIAVRAERGGGRMSPEDRNTATVLRYVHAFNTGDTESLRALFHPEAEIYGVLGAFSLREALALWREFHDALGMHLKLESLAADGGVVAARYTETGTFRGPLSKLPGVKPTGRSYVLTAMEWFTFAPGDEGLIFARHGVRDGASYARQLGLPAYP